MTVSTDAFLRRECRAQDYADLSRPDFERQLRCGADGVLYSGCCRECFIAGIREACCRCRAA